MTERDCADCGRPIPPQTEKGRPRKYCVACRPPRARREPGARAHAQPVEDQNLIDRYTAELEEAGRLDTPDGAHVMLLARLLARGGHSASGAAALSRELRTAMNVALRDLGSDGGDLVDELARRREEKLAGHGS